MVKIKIGYEFDVPMRDIVEAIFVGVDFDNFVDCLSPYDVQRIVNRGVCLGMRYEPNVIGFKFRWSSRLFSDTTANVM